MSSQAVHRAHKSRFVSSVAGPWSDWLATTIDIRKPSVAGLSMTPATWEAATWTAAATSPWLYAKVTDPENGESSLAVEIEHDPEAKLLRPSDDPIERREAIVFPDRGIVVREELAIGERHAHGVEPHALQQHEIVARDVARTPLPPEGTRLVGADEPGDHLFDVAWRRGALLEPEHVAFGHEPVAQIHPAGDEHPAVGRDEVPSADLHERGM